MFETIKEDAYSTRATVQKCLTELTERVPDALWFQEGFQAEMKVIQVYATTLNLLDDIIDALECNDMEYAEKRVKVYNRFIVFTKFVKENGVI